MSRFLFLGGCLFAAFALSVTLSVAFVAFVASVVVVFSSYTPVFILRERKEKKRKERKIKSGSVSLAFLRQSEKRWIWKKTRRVVKYSNNS